MERASTGEVWRETRSLTRSVQKLYFGAAAAVIVSTLITLAGPALVRYAVDNGIVKHDLHPLNVAAVALLVLAALKPLVVRAQTLLAATASERFLNRLRAAAFEKLQALPLGFFEQERTGVLVSRLTSDVQALDEFLREAMVEVIGSGLQIALTVVVLVILSPMLALVSLIALPVLIASSWAFHHGAGRRVPRDPRPGRRDADHAAGRALGRARDPGVPARAADDRRLPAAQQRADRRLAARLVREHPAVHDDPAGADGRARGGAAHRVLPVSRRQDQRGHDRRLRALPGAAVRPDRALQRVAGRVPPGPGCARQGGRAAAGAERGHAARRARSTSPPTARSSCATSASATRPEAAW